LLRPNGATVGAGELKPESRTRVGVVFHLFRDVGPRDGAERSGAKRSRAAYAKLLFIFFAFPGRPAFDGELVPLRSNAFDRAAALNRAILLQADLEGCAANIACRREGLT